MKRYFILSLILILLLAGCAPASSTETGGSSTEESGDNNSHTGWVTEAGKTVYVNADGTLHTGWLELNDTRYYLDEQGVLQTGWLELEGQTYYLKSDGSITRGKAVIDDRTFYFTSTGAKIILVNPWHFIPADYTSDIVNAEDGYMIDSSCKDDLLQMLADCRKAGFDARITSAYRRPQTQINLYNNKVWYFLDLGYDEATARKEAAKIVAVPGTSEHELGLAVDLVDSSYWVLDEEQENTPAQKWLIAHCWEYGFILRYPNEKSDSTGIIYEPWHYRYVGKELALELKDTGLCLEEYLQSLY